MQIDIDTVEHVATLARLDLTPVEKQRLVGEMTQLLDFVEQLDRLNLDSIEPKEGETDSPVVAPVPVGEDAQHLRVDEPKQPLTRDALLMNAPEQEDHAFVVPKILAG